MGRLRLRFIAIALGVTLGVSGLAYAAADTHPDDDTDIVASDTDSNESNDTGDENGSDEGEDNGTEADVDENGTEADENGTEEDDVENGTEDNGTEEDATDDDAEDGSDGGDESTGDEFTGDEFTGDEFTGDESAESQSSANGVERSTEGCDGGAYRNHGQYVSQSEERPRSGAARSSCGKPTSSARASGEHPAKPKGQSGR